MNETTQKARIRVKAEIVPPHAIVAPDNAPTCYGDQLVRRYGRVCGGCGFEPLCADFLDRRCSKSASGSDHLTEPRMRVVWPADAPLIFNIDSFRDPWPHMHERPRSLEDCEQLQLLPGGTGASESLREAVYRVHVSNLLPLSTAVEIAILADRFRTWLDGTALVLASVHECASAAKTWFAAEVTRRALRMQGRPDAYSVERVHEVRRGLFDDKRSLKSVAPTLDRDLALFQAF